MTILLDLWLAMRKKKKSVPAPYDSTTLQKRQAVHPLPKKSYSTPIRGAIIFILQNKGRQKK